MTLIKHCTDKLLINTSMNSWKYLSLTNLFISCFAAVSFFKVAVQIVLTSDPTISLQLILNQFQQKQLIPLVRRISFLQENGLASENSIQDILDESNMMSGFLFFQIIHDSTLVKVGFLLDHSWASAFCRPGYRLCLVIGIFWGCYEKDKNDYYSKFVIIFFCISRIMGKLSWLFLSERLLMQKNL